MRVTVSMATACESSRRSRAFARAALHSMTAFFDSSAMRDAAQRDASIRRAETRARSDRAARSRASARRACQGTRRFARDVARTAALRRASAARRRASPIWPSCRTRRCPFGGLAATAAGGAGARLRVARADLRARRGAARLLAARARAASPPAFAPATSCTTASPITSRRPARCSRRARMRSAARCFPAAPARPSCRCRRWPTSQPDGYVGTPSFLKIILEKADEHRRRAAVAEEGAGVRRSRSRRACAMRSRARGIARLPGLCDRRSRLRSPTRPARAKGLIVDEGVLVEIVRPGHRRSGRRRAKSAKSSSRRCSTPTIR